MERTYNEPVKMLEKKLRGWKEGRNGERKEGRNQGKKGGREERKEGRGKERRQPGERAAGETQVSHLTG